MHSGASYVVVLFKWLSGAKAILMMVQHHLDEVYLLDIIGTTLGIYGTLPAVGELLMLAPILAGGQPARRLRQMANREIRKESEETLIKNYRGIFTAELKKLVNYIE